MVLDRHCLHAAYKRASLVLTVWTKSLGTKARAVACESAATCASSKQFPHPRAFARLPRHRRSR
jgi:hypothetical protein